MMRYAVWLQAVLYEGSNKVIPIIEKFGTPQRVYESNFKILCESGLFSPKELERIKTIRLDFAEKIIKQCENNRIGLISIFDSLFPECLRNIPNPPIVLYTKGKIPDFDNEPAVCIVGPRKVSEFGEKAAYSLSARLSKSGIIVVSGCALGTDSAAHIGALKNGGLTVGVLPCGHLNGYLAQNKALRDKISENCCLISEYPPEKSVNPSSFKVRNRLMAALTQCTVVVEAASRSGALITAHYACDYGKELFVIPGNPTYSHYKGSNALLREGAKPLLDASDIFNEYLPRFADKIDLEKAFKKTDIKKSSKKEENKKEIKILPSGLSKEAKMLYNQLNRQKFSADDLLGFGLSDDELLSALTELEMEQLIRASAGGIYEKI